MWMLYGKFADKRDNPVSNQNIYNVEGDIRFSTPKCVENLFFFSPFP